MTYRELLEELNRLSEEQANSDVTVCCDDEFCPVKSLKFTEETDVLDKNHPYLVKE